MGKYIIGEPANAVAWDGEIEADSADAALDVAELRMDACDYDGADTTVDIDAYRVCVNGYGQDVLSLEGHRAVTLTD